MLKLQNMRPWEKVLVELRRHWIVYFFVFSYFLIFVILSWLSFYFFWLNTINLIINCVIWLVWLLFCYVQWLNYELDIFIITNNRIIWVEQISFLNRTVSEANLWQVQEVNSRTKWILANLLDYWDVLIQTAWTTSNFDMTYAPNAIQNSRQILNIVDNYRDMHSPLHKENPEL